MKNIFHLFQKSAQRFPSRPFLVESGGQWTVTYADLEQQVLARRQTLHDQGLRPHCRWVHRSHNSVDFVRDMLAVNACGAAFVPLSPEIPTKTVEAVDRLVGPTLRGEWPSGWRDRDDPLSTILFTSGTSGTPKGVLLSQSNLFTNVAMIGQRIPETLVSHTDQSYAFLPWFHSYGLVCELLFLMSRGASLVLPTTRSPRLLVDGIRRVQPTLLFTVPRFLEKMEQVSKRYWYVPDFLKRRAMLGGRLRYLSVGGARVAPSTLAFFRQTWRTPVFQGYGLTETGPMVSLQSPVGMANGCGRPLDGVTIRVGATGELELQSPSVCQGYLGSNNTVWRPPKSFWRATGSGRGM